MSGFEIAGLVLGVIPIVIEALSAYQAGKGLFAIMRKSHGLVDELIHKLKTQRLHFYLDILELLREARVPAILMESDPMPDKCVEILQAAETSNVVEQYLGSPFFDNFLEIIGLYEKYLQKITSKLSHIVRPKNAARGDLAAVIQARKCPDTCLSFKGKLKFAIDRDSLGILVEDLGSERYSLGKLIRRVKTKREWEAREPTGSSRTLTYAVSRVRERAASLYQAACKSCVCDRHLLHTLMIRLEHRIPESKVSGAGSSAVAFRLCVPIEDASLQRIEVHARDSNSPTTKPVVNTTSAASGGGLKIPSIIVTETSNESYPTAARVLVGCICKDAQSAREKGRVLSLELTSAAVLEATDKYNELPHSYDRLISLADFLKDTAVDADARMSPIEQTLLALNIVSSVLQLRPTVWCSQPWNSIAIKLPVQAVGSMIDVLRTPYIEQTIDPSTLKTQGGVSVDLTTEAAKTTMLELAILLLEILHHKSIAEWAARYDQTDPRTYWERYAAATRWLELSTSKLLPRHIQAVEECLKLCARSKLSWDTYFQQFYCENIIKPLQELAM
ncbi:hypothetical protein B0I35DRAFT_509797 [Stachybotrys elegans]|uniref:DUF7580 domain-containing protein n=1 Tax=Stachybotrys elegans TaxID=80388 RepID=A0A8K0SVJ7_9HYPO|nr:hypothetical protein B0I35DRAFT_509797 [Stachybotrys elegans]